MRYGQNSVDAVSVSTSTGERMWKGISKSGMVEKRHAFTSSVPLLAFYGTEDSKILSVGFVVVNPLCVLGGNSTDNSTSNPGGPDFNETQTDDSNSSLISAGGLHMENMLKEYQAEIIVTTSTIVCCLCVALVLIAYFRH
jgi:hypothetical protein